MRTKDKFFSAKEMRKLIGKVRYHTRELAAVLNVLDASATDASELAHEVEELVRLRKRLATQAFDKVAAHELFLLDIEEGRDHVDLDDRLRDDIESVAGRGGWSQVMLARRLVRDEAIVRSRDKERRLRAFVVKRIDAAYVRARTWA